LCRPRPVVGPQVNENLPDFHGAKTCALASIY
jgi:hypothetical protein